MLVKGSRWPWPRSLQTPKQQERLVATGLGASLPDMTYALATIGPVDASDLGARTTSDPPAAHASKTWTAVPPRGDSLPSLYDPSSSALLVPSPLPGCQGDLRDPSGRVDMRAVRRALERLNESIVAGSAVGEDVLVMTLDPFLDPCSVGNRLLRGRPTNYLRAAAMTQGDRPNFVATLWYVLGGLSLEKTIEVYRWASRHGTGGPNNAAATFLAEQLRAMGFPPTLVDMGR
ncbi:hypothetical protein ml_263 [Mollivirus sibericum]|uniref:hypothetical protein n=1 Tax=Mollivirus sibericum TaxID=1678078 RepID=UPI0006B2EE8C|nr:hypothetical protein ml_263 [Mollivirus sibericum]ALD62065.1 hypothetical protein ml_263 [Mollivirus sibericum]